MSEPLSKDQLTFFNEQGYVILDDILPTEDLAAFTGALRRVIRFEIQKATSKLSSGMMPVIPQGTEFGLGMESLEKHDHAHIAQINDTLYGMPETIRLVSTPLICDLVREILGRPPGSPLFCTNGSVVLAIPKDTRHTHGWHKDTFYTLPDSNYVQIWAPLIQDSTVEMGTLRVCPGSHKAGWHGQAYVAAADYIHRFQVTPEEIAKYSAIDVPMKLGQVLLFHSGLAHSAGNNHSKTTRFSLAAVFHQIEDESFAPKEKKTPEEHFKQLYGVPASA